VRRAFSGVVAGVAAVAGAGCGSGEGAGSDPPAGASEGAGSDGGGGGGVTSVTSTGGFSAGWIGRSTGASNRAARISKCAPTLTAAVTARSLVLRRGPLNPPPLPSRGGLLRLLAAWREAPEQKRFHPSRREQNHPSASG
jgi:hypothetical protein